MVQDTETFNVMYVSIHSSICHLWFIHILWTLCLTIAARSSRTGPNHCLFPLRSSQICFFFTIQWRNYN